MSSRSAFLKLVERSLGSSEHTGYKRGMQYLYQACTIFSKAHASIDYSWVHLVISKFETKTVESVGTAHER